MALPGQRLSQKTCSAIRRSSILSPWSPWSPWRLLTVSAVQIRDTDTANAVLCGWQIKTTLVISTDFDLSRLYSLIILFHTFSYFSDPSFHEWSDPWPYPCWVHQPVKRPKHGRTRRFASCNPTVPYASRIWVRQDALVHASANKRLELSTGQVDRFTAVRILGPGIAIVARLGKRHRGTAARTNSITLTAISQKRTDVLASGPPILSLSLSLSLSWPPRWLRVSRWSRQDGQSTDFATQAARTFAWHMSSPKSLLCLVQHTKLAQVHVCISGIRHPAFFLLWLLRFPVLCLIVCVCVNSQHNNSPAFKAAALIVAINHAACTLDSWVHKGQERFNVQNRVKCETETQHVQLTYLNRVHYLHSLVKSNPTHLQLDIKRWHFTKGKLWQAAVSSKLLWYRCLSAAANAVRQTARQDSTPWPAYQIHAHTHTQLYIYIIYIQCIILSPCVLCDWFISLSFSIQGMYRTIVAISAISTAISTISTSRISGHSHDRSWLQEPVPVLSSGPFRSSQGAQPQRSFAQRQPDVIAPHPHDPHGPWSFSEKKNRTSQDITRLLDISWYYLSYLVIIVISSRILYIYICVCNYIIKL